MNAFPQSYSQEFLQENDGLVIGLDIQESLRLVVAEVTVNCAEPTILEHHRFLSLDGLHRFLKPSIRERILAISVEANYEDPSGAKVWLSTHKIPIHHHHNPGWSSYTLKLQSQLALSGLPRPYELAYSLAFLSSYRLHNETTVYKLWRQASRLKEMVDDHYIELARLSHALGKDGVVLTLEQWLAPF
jgi:hypothetical protein